MSSIPFYYPRPAPFSEYLVEEDDFDITRSRDVVHLSVWNGWSRRIESYLVEYSVSCLTIRGDSTQFDSDLDFVRDLNLKELRLVLYGTFDLSAVAAMKGLARLSVVNRGGYITIKRYPHRRPKIVELKIPYADDVAENFVGPALESAQFTDIGSKAVDLRSAIVLRDLSLTRAGSGASVQLSHDGHLRSLQLVECKSTLAGIDAAYHHLRYFSVGGRSHVDWGWFFDGAQLYAVLLMEVPPSRELERAFEIDSLRCIDLFPPLSRSRIGRAVREFNARRCGVATLTPVIDALQEDA